MFRIGISSWRWAGPALTGLGLTAAAWALPAAAQVPLELKQAVEAAWSRQPEARSAAQRREVAAAQRVAAAAWTPEPMALTASSRTDRWTSNNGARELEIGVAVPLWLPGERARSLSLVDAQSGAFEATQRAAQWRTAGVVRQAWWAAHLAQQDVGSAQLRLAAAQQLAADVARRLRAGDLARADQHQADAAVAAAQAERATLTAAQTQALQALRALFASAGGPFAISAVAEPEPHAAVQPNARSDAQGDAQRDAHHPALAESALRLEQARRAQALAAVQTRGNPELTLLTTRDRGAAGEPRGQSITLAVRFPLGSVARSHGKTAGAAADVAEAQAMLELERDKVAADVDAAQARVAGARDALQALERRATLSRQTVGFIDKSFRLGETDLPSRLRAELEAAEAERLAGRARIERAHSISALRQALGLPVP